ncbi:MAG: hypothetical protein ACR2PO_06550 [Methyloligellaceae bacterium]
MSEILGKQPRVEPGHLTEIPNAQAIRMRIWMPGLDEGFVPQGLAFADGRVLVAAYRSTSPRLSRGESRVFAIDAASGASVGQFKLPEDVGHPGGLAYDGEKHLFVADRGKLYRIDLQRALADGEVTNAIEGRADVDREIGPSYLAYHDRHLWFGPYEKHGEPRVYKMPVEVAFPKSGAAYLTAEDATASFAADVRVQGAAVDAHGFLWLSQSGSDGGAVRRHDPGSGALLDLFELMAGLEDLAFGPDGRLWSVSEAGSRRWRRWSTYYPLVFSVDVSKLR